jgi:hypothetical protein
MPEVELKALADDIKQNGQQQHAVIYEGKILDGRNRAAACKLAGVSLKTVPLPKGVAPVGYVMSSNLRRRQLSPNQLAVVAAKLMQHFGEEAAKRKRVLSGTRANADGTQPEVPENLPEPDECGDARDKAAKATGANPRYVSDAVKLQHEAPDLFKLVESGELKITKAIKQLECRHEVPKDRPDSMRKDFLAVLWDDADAPPSRAPEKSYGAQSYPNLAFFHLHQAGDAKIAPTIKQGLMPVALFVVPVEPIQPIGEVEGGVYFQASCRFLTLSVRGTVPEPATLPGQIVDGGFDGVVKMIAAMFPKVLKAVSTTGGKCPAGWSPIPRDTKPKADSAHEKGKATKPPVKNSSLVKPPMETPASATAEVEPEPEPADYANRPRGVAEPTSVKKTPPIAVKPTVTNRPAQRPAPELEDVED